MFKEYVKNLCFYDRTFNNPKSLSESADYIASQLLQRPAHQIYAAYGHIFKNLIVRINNNPNIKKTIIGGHYDCCGGVGADDNASSVSVLINLANSLKDKPVNIEIVFFTLEEPPAFATGIMGSKMYYESIKNEKIRMMINLDMIGYYTEKENDLFVGSYHNSKEEIMKIDSSLNNNKIKFRIEDITKKKSFYDMADHMWFYGNKIPTLIVCDDGPMRNHNYHTDKDTPDTLNYDNINLVYESMKKYLEDSHAEI